jgi:hypothetical protein
LKPSFRRGGNSFHNKYAASLGEGEWTLTLPTGLTTAEGYSSVGYDGLISFDVLFEAKTGHQLFPWSNGWAVGDREQQFAKQESVANYCGFNYLIAVDNALGALALKTAFPDKPIFEVPFGGGPYQ